MNNVKQGYVHVNEKNNQFTLYRDGKPYFIKGVGGSTNLEIASKYGANSFRTWGANRAVETLDKAATYDMTVMLGIQMSKKNEHYLDEAYKQAKRDEVQALLNTVKEHKSLLIWTLGNEINLGTNSPEAWVFVNELAELIKSQDVNHPVCTVIAGAGDDVINNIAEYAKAIDIIGINAYAGVLPRVKEDCKKNKFNGSYIITEWGPTGFWEVDKTDFGAPIEQTSAEKSLSYKEGYEYIESNNDLFLGSYVFLWGQKEERTPTWFGMFVEENEELGLTGELCPTVDVMHYGWTGTWPTNQAPNLHTLKINGLEAKDSVALTAGQAYSSTVNVTDPDGDQLTFVWEILVEATVLGFGGSYEPRPERVGNIIKGTESEITFHAPEQGQYRLYVYALDGKGHVATANIPFIVK